jgi:hypothetical protein
MSATTILLEVHKLNDVSDHLRSLAGQHPVVSEGLLTISSHVRNSATILEELVTTKMSHAAMEDHAIRSGEGLRCHSGRLW